MFQVSQVPHNSVYCSLPLMLRDPSFVYNVKRYIHLDGLFSDSCQLLTHAAIVLQLGSFSLNVSWSFSEGIIPSELITQNDLTVTQ